MTKISKLKQAGRLYNAVFQTEADLVKKLGFSWKLYLLKKLIFFKKYSLKQKIKIISSGIDPDKKFVKYLYPKRYEIFEEYYNKEIRNLPLFFSLDDKNYFERLRKFFTSAGEIFYLDLYRISSLILDNDRVIDLGANIGLFSIYVKELFPHTHIIVFEPEYNNFKILQKNLFPYSEMTLLKQAVGEKIGIKKLKVSNNILAHTIDDKESDFDIRPGPGFVSSQNIRVVTLDSIIKGKVDVIKADVEGYENKALLGAKNTINKYLPLLLIAVEHSKKQRSNVINLMQSICSQYKFIDLNNDVICFYIPKIHQNRIKKLSKFSLRG